MAGELLKLALGGLGMFGLSKVLGGKKKSKKKKKGSSAKLEVVYVGIGYSNVLGIPVQWRIVRKASKYGWDWEPQLDEDLEIGIGASPITFPTEEAAGLDLQDHLDLVTLPDPDDPDIDDGGGEGPVSDHGPGVDPYLDPEDDDPDSGVVEGGEGPPPPPPPPGPMSELDFTKVPAFALGTGGEIHQHLKQGVGIHTIILQRTKKTLPGLGLGTWGTDWYVWQPGVILSKSHAMQKGRDEDNDKALDEAMAFIDGYDFGIGVTNYPAQVYPQGANPLALPAITQPGALATSPDRQIVGVGPAYWDLIGDYAEELIGKGELGLDNLVNQVSATYLPPIDIESSAGLIALRNEMRARIEAYLEQVIGA